MMISGVPNLVSIFGVRERVLDVARGSDRRVYVPADPVHGSEKAATVCAATT